MNSQWSAAMISPAGDFAGAPLLRTEFALVPGHGAMLSAEPTSATFLAIYHLCKLMV